MSRRISLISENPYAPPQSFLSNPANLRIENIKKVTLWREGNVLVTRKGAHWPDRCVVCNTPTRGIRIKRRFSWHHPAIYLFIFLNIIIYIAVAIFARKTCAITLGMCPTHRRRRRIGIILGWAGFLVSLFSVPVGLSLSNDWGYVLGVGGGIGLFTFPIIGLLLSNFILVKRIDSHFMRIKVPRRFLESIPMLPEI